MRGLKAPPRRTVAPASRTCRAMRQSMSWFSTVQGPAMERACLPPTSWRGHGAAADLDDGVLLVELAAGELVGRHDRDDLLDAIEGGEVVLVDDALFADCADDGAESAAREMGFAAHLLDLADNAVDRGLRHIGGHHDNHAVNSSKSLSCLALRVPRPARRAPDSMGKGGRTQ